MHEAKQVLLHCYVCGVEYDSLLLAQHIPECLKNWHASQLLLPEKLRCPEPQAPSIPIPPCTDNSTFAGRYNEEAWKIYMEQSLTPCDNCKKRFKVESLLKHLKHCKPKNVLTIPTDDKTKKGGQDALIICYLCGDNVSNKVLLAHIPQCKKRWLTRQQILPVKLRRLLPKPPYLPPHILSTDVNSKNFKEDLEQYNKAAFEIFKKSTMNQCPICHESFRPENLLQHIEICDVMKKTNSPKRANGSVVHCSVTFSSEDISIRSPTTSPIISHNTTLPIATTSPTSLAKPRKLFKSRVSASVDNIFRKPNQDEESPRETTKRALTRLSEHLSQIQAQKNQVKSENPTPRTSRSRYRIPSTVAAALEKRVACKYVFQIFVLFA